MHSRHSSNDNDYKDSPDNIRCSASDHKNDEITVKTLKHWHLKVLFLTIAYIETIVIVTWWGGEKIQILSIICLYLFNSKIFMRQMQKKSKYEGRWARGGIIIDMIFFSIL